MHALTANGMRPIHPGEVLREEFLLPMGLTAHALRWCCMCPRRASMTSRASAAP